ncbi:hypothetical protein MKW94_014900 [Papaver nudicaule]|uniref:MADS-box domain-containing protein n=1 Tax=Papaver nudicaule TaxID=74823 RepID=A0AA41VJU5_PAPNU|nr:hypothetical protein [Papaver nudicaule]
MKNQVMEMNKKRKGGAGRQKIKIEKIQSKSKMLVTFSKRKKGLFKKAEELSVLCGAEIGLVAFSPAGKPFVFGNPHLLIDRFVNNKNAEDFGSSGIQNDENQLSVFDEQRWFMEVEKEEEEVEKNKRGLSMESLINSNLGGNPNDQYWWDTYIDGLSLEELKQMRNDMEQLKMCVEKRSHDLTNVASSSSSTSSSYKDESLSWMTLPAVNAIEDDDDVLTVNNSIGQTPPENGYGTDGYFGSTNQDALVCDFSSGCDDYENVEMINELLSGFAGEVSADMVY